MKDKIIPVPSQWSMKSLREVSKKIVDGSHNPAKEQDTGLPMLSARNIENGFINWDAKYRFISEADFDQENKRTDVKDNDVLLTIVGTIGRSCVIPKNSPLFTLQRSVAVIKVDGINPKFLCYQLQSTNVQNYLINNAKGTAQKGIYLGKLGKLPILIAPEDQQKQIVAKIEELFSHIDAGVVALQKAKKLLKQYRQSVLKAAVTGELTREWREQNIDKLEPASELLKRILTERRSNWEQQQLEQFKAQGKVPKDDKWKLKYKESKPASVFNDLRYPDVWELASIHQIAEVLLGKMLDKSKHTTGKLLPYLRNINVRWGNVVTDDLLKMYFEPHEIDRYEVHYGDVLVCEGGEPGRAAVWEKDNIPILYQKALHRVRFYEPLSPKYLVFLLEYYALTGFLDLYFTGSTIKHFTKESFITLPFPLPSKDEMEEIVLTIDSKLEASTRLNTAINIQLARAEKNKQSILSSAFSGMLIKPPVDI